MPWVGCQRRTGTLMEAQRYTAHGQVHILASSYRTQPLPPMDLIGRPLAN